MKPVLFLIALLIPFLGHTQVTNKNDLPELQVKQILDKPTAFPDSMYAHTDWQTFTASDMAKKPVDYLNIDYGLLNAAVFYYTNKYRASLRLPLLTFLPELRDAAIFHSLEMVNRKFYNHMNPYNKTMYTPKDRILYFKFKGGNMGENIDMQYMLNYKTNKPFWADEDGQHFKYHYGNSLTNKGDIPFCTYDELAEAMVKAWIESPPHRENLQNKLFKYLGCGAIGDPGSATKTTLPQAYGTQDFGG